LESLSLFKKQFFARKLIMYILVVVKDMFCHSFEIKVLTGNITKRYVLYVCYLNFRKEVLACLEEGTEGCLTLGKLDP
jgi:hypothetical protein